MKFSRGGRKLNKKAKRIIIGSILLFFCVGILSFIMVFHVEDVEVMGNTRYTEEEIKEIVLDEPFSSNSLIISWLKGNQKTEDIPFVNSYKVERVSNHKIRIIVNEKQIIGYVRYMESYMYFDKDGYVVESSSAVADVENGQAEVIKPEAVEVIRPEPVEEDTKTKEATYQVAVKDVPLIEGLDVGKVVVGEQLAAENKNVFNTILGITRMVEKFRIQPDKVVFDEEYNITLIYGDIRVSLGQDDLLEEKITRTAAILPKLAGQSGVLHLEDYTDGMTNIIFSKDVAETASADAAGSPDAKKSRDEVDGGTDDGSEAGQDEGTDSDGSGQPDESGEEDETDETAAGSDEDGGVNNWPEQGEEY